MLPGAGSLQTSTAYYLLPFTMSAPVAAKASTSTMAEVSVQASDEAISITPIPSFELLEGLDDQIRTFSFNCSTTKRCQNAF
jgi:hypothetical protein